MTETIERFLKEIAARVGADRVEEVRLFPPIRQAGVESCVAVVAAAAAANTRHTVYSARYRHTLKGSERGNWEVEVTAEADAPLVTVDQVVRGVMKRSGEQFDPERIPGGAFRTIIGQEHSEPEPGTADIQATASLPRAGEPA